MPEKLDIKYMGDGIIVGTSDCIFGLGKVRNQTIDLVLTSPPYDQIRTYTGYSLDLCNFGKELGRVLKWGGICALVMQDQTKDGVKTLTSFKTVVDWVQNTDLNLWETVIYSRKGNEGGWWKTRLRVDHEYVFIFVRGNKPTYFNKEHLMVPSKHAGKMWSGTQRRTDGTTIRRVGTVCAKKCRGTIWHYNTSNSEGNRLKLKHPATFPDKLAEDIILAYTKPGSVVLDPMCGSGTVLRMAKKHGRRAVGFDISDEYIVVPLLANRRD
ncbi:MAG: site-specific DNA-methyltransferase [Candidatus Blackburnbacteria bacterium]|nr:site-specific DNA-methyltransferase [Candidatus Blackburnbacteria bacterium]